MDLERANDNSIAIRNEKARPFVWHADGREILEKINRSRQALGMEELDPAPPQPVPPEPKGQGRGRAKKKG